MIEQQLAALAADVKALIERSFPPPATPLATVKEAAAFTKLTERTIWKGIKSGKYTPYRHGKAVRVCLQQILDRMAEEAIHGGHPHEHRSVRASSS